jgi:uncharacterized membrane protein
MDAAPASRRDETLDAARGLAVLLMVWVHFVPDDGPWTSVWAFDALPAAMFTMLVGVSAAAGGERSWRAVVWRAASLVLLGLPFWVWVWPNDILIPIACMLPVVALLRGQPQVTWVVLSALLGAVPWATASWGGFAWTEIRADGTHEANHSLGMHTLRYFVLHGAYPLLPWLAFPLLGLRLGRARSSRRALCGWLVAGFVAMLAALVCDRWGDAEAGGVAAHLDVTWQPTSLPFVLLWGGAACASIASLYLLRLRSRILTVVGRWSLQHYLAHLVLVFWPLTIWWPDEDWSWALGASVATGYIAVACLAATRRSGRRCLCENHHG